MAPSEKDVTGDLFGIRERVGGEEREETLQRQLRARREEAIEASASMRPVARQPMVWLTYVVLTVVFAAEIAMVAWALLGESP